MKEKMSKTEKQRKKFIENENYPRKCPDCGCDLTPAVWKPESKYEDIVKWMNKTEPDEAGNAVGGLCPANDCHAQIICPKCGKVHAKGAKSCPKCGYRFDAVTVRRVCLRCNFAYDREVAGCPKCGLPSKLSCEQCGAPMKYGLQYCPRGHFNEWDKRYPRLDLPREEPPRPVSPLNGSFVITPYGPMFVFDPTPAPKPQPQPQPQPQPVAPAPAPVLLPPEEEPKSEDAFKAPVNKRAIAGIIFSILSILCAVAFPVAYAYFNSIIAGIVVAAVSVVLALIGIGLGFSGRAARPKTGAAAIVLGIIGILACAAACLWVFLYGGLDMVKGWLNIK